MCSFSFCLFFLHLYVMSRYAILRYTLIFIHHHLLHAVKINAAINIYLYSHACLVPFAL